MAVDKVEKQKNRLIVEVQSLPGVTCQAGNVADYDFNITKPGYRFLGCVGFSMNAGGASSTVYAILYSNTTFRYRIRNNGSTAVAPTNVVCNFLYEKE